MDEEEFGGRGILQTIHSIPLGMWGKKKEAFWKEAGIQQERENIFDKLFEGQIRNDCKLEMHFYDIIYQHEDSAWLLQAILISLMNNRAKNWSFKHENLTKMMLKFQKKKM